MYGGSWADGVVRCKPGGGGGGGGGGGKLGGYSVERSIYSLSTHRWENCYEFSVFVFEGFGLWDHRERGIMMHPGGGGRPQAGESSSLR